jgi:hypothetical protein
MSFAGDFFNRLVVGETLAVLPQALTKSTNPTVQMSSKKRCFIVSLLSYQRLMITVQDSPANDK